MLIVADKYQTGYDEPLVCAMYVDKKLSGIAAVQTLSRLNRTAPDKPLPIVLDFVNDPAVIQKAFADYYTDAYIAQETDPNALYTLADRLDLAGFYTEQQMHDIAETYLSASDGESLQPELAKVVNKWKVALDNAKLKADRDKVLAFRSDARAYRHAWDFLSQIVEYQPAPPGHVARFISSLAEAGAKRGTIGRKLSALRYVHRLVGLDDPTSSARVAMVWEGIQRDIARTGGRQAQVDQAPPLMPPMLWDVLDACPTLTTWTTRDNETSLVGARDRCLLLVGFFGALRRSELAALQVEWLHDDARGLVIELPFSKTNQTGTRDDLVALPRLANPERCPVRAVETWCQLAGITTGPLLRRVTKGNTPGTYLSDSGVNRVVVDAVRRAGLSPTGQPVDLDNAGATALARRVPYSAHSLRAGFVTYAHSRGATASQIAHQTRHQSLASVRTYTRLSSVWDDNAVTALGL